MHKEKKKFLKKELDFDLHENKKPILLITKFFI